jgi:galactokinase
LIFQAPERDMWIAAQYNSREQYACLALDLNESALTTFNLQSAKTRRTVTKRPLPRWARYPAGVIMTLSGMGLDVRGMNAVICGDEPPGPRYEYSLGILFAALCHELNDQPYLTTFLTEIVDAVHRDYVEGGA